MRHYDGAVYWYHWSPGAIVINAAIYCDFVKWYWYAWVSISSSGAISWEYCYSIGVVYSAVVGRANTLQ